MVMGHFQLFYYKKTDAPYNIIKIASAIAIITVININNKG